MSHRHSLAVLGTLMALIHLGAFWWATEALSSHGASMPAMIAKMDQVEYLQLADTMLGSHRFALSPDGPAEIFRTPGYPAFVALTDLVSGHWYWAPFVGSAVLLGLLAVIVALIATELGLAYRHALAAGALMGVSSGAFLLSMTATGSDILYTLIYAMAALVALRVRDDVHASIVVGLLLGGATLTRPIGILASLPLLFAVGYMRGLTRRAYLRATLFALMAWALVLAPWYARNALVSGTPRLSTVSTFNITYYNAPMNEAFWQHASETDARLAIMHIIGTTTPEAMRLAQFQQAMEQYNRSYLRAHALEYGIFHLYRTVPFFFMSGFNVINAVLAHEAPTLRSPLFPTEGENLTRLVATHQWGTAVSALGHYWFTTLERLIWVVAILSALAAPLLASGSRRRILLVFAAIIVATIILVSPVTQARYRFPAEPFIWAAAVYTMSTLWQQYRSRG